MKHSMKHCGPCKKIKAYKKHHQKGMLCLGRKCQFCKKLDMLMAKHHAKHSLKFGSRRRNQFRGRFGRSLKRPRFGKISGLNSMMGNNDSSDMSAFQSYTGMSPDQMSTHLTGIPSNLRDTFYANTI